MRGWHCVLFEEKTDYERNQMCVGIGVVVCGGVKHGGVGWGGGMGGSGGMKKKGTHKKRVKKEKRGRRRKKLRRERVEREREEESGKDGLRDWRSVGVGMVGLVVVVVAAVSSGKQL